MIIMMSISSSVIRLPRKHKRLFDLYKTTLHRHRLTGGAMVESDNIEERKLGKLRERSLRLDVKVRDLLNPYAGRLDIDHMYIHTIAGKDAYHFYRMDRRLNGDPDIEVEFV